MLCPIKICNQLVQFLYIDELTNVRISVWPNVKTVAMGLIMVLFFSAQLIKVEKLNELVANFYWTQHQTVYNDNNGREEKEEVKELVISPFESMALLMLQWWSAKRMDPNILYLETTR
jgi:hypothetical protein